jgi:hypothetical protein
LVFLISFLSYVDRLLSGPIIIRAIDLNGPEVNTSFAFISWDLAVTSALEVGTFAILGRFQCSDILETVLHRQTLSSFDLP